MSKTSRFATIILLAALAVLVAKVVYVQATTIPSFDGAMNLDVARSISLGEGYRRNYASREPFPHEIQTGAPYILPSALVFRLAGVGLLQSQVVNILYFLLLLAVTYLLVDRTGTRWVAVLATCTVAATPGMSEFGFSGYGEVPALALFLASTLAYFQDPESESPRSALFAGFLIGLAVLTKTVMLIGAGALGLVALLAAVGDGLRIQRHRLVRLGVFLGGAAAVVMAMEIWRSLALGGARPWLHWWRKEAGSIFEQAGVAHHGGHVSHLAGKLLSHLELLANDYGLPAWVVATGLCMLALALGSTLLARSRDKQRQRTLVVLIAAAVYLAWWLLLTPTAKAWHRRILDGMICADLGLVMVAAGYLGALGSEGAGQLRKLAMRGASALIVLASLVLSYRGTRDALAAKPDPMQVAGFMHTVEQVKALPPNAYVFAIGWYSAPRITLFSGRHVLDFNDTPVPRIDEHGPAYFIDGPLSPAGVWKTVHNVYGVTRTPQQDFALIGPYPLRPRPLSASGAPVQRYISTGSRYPYMRGFNQSEGSNGRWLTSDNLILLTPHEGDRFALQVYAPGANAYLFSSPPRVTVSFNDCPAPSQTMQPGASTTLYFDIPESCHVPFGQPVNIRVEVDNLLNTAMTTDPRALSLLSHSLGFVGTGP